MWSSAITTRKKRLFECAGIALICAFVGEIPEASGAEDQILSFSISASRDVVTAGDNIPMQVTLKNLSEKEVPIGFSDLVQFDYDVEVLGPAGGAAPESKSAVRRRNNPLKGPVHWITGTLAPGGERTEKFDIEDFADLSTPGAYSVQLLWPRKSPAPLRSNVVVIMVEASAATSSPAAPDVLASAQALHPKATQAPLLLAIDTDHTAVSVGRPIDVGYELTNTSNRTIRLSPGTVGEYAVEARDEMGIAVPDRDLNKVRRERMVRDDPDPSAVPAFSGAVSIPPGRKVTSGVEVDRFVDLSKPGIYSIQLWRMLPKGEGGGEIRSNVIVVTVKP